MSVVYTGSLLTGLVADWRLEGNGNDSGPNNKPLTLVGSPTYINPGGNLGQAIFIDVSLTQYGSLVDNTLWEMPSRTGKMTVAGWINTKSTGTRPIIMKATSANASEYGLFMATGTTPTWRIGNGSSNAMVSHSTTIALNTWAFIVGTFDTAGGSSAIRLNHGLYNAAGGQSLVGWQQVASVGTTSTTSDLELFRIPYSTSTRYDGWCARMSLWERVLTQAEIDSLYNAGKAYAGSSSIRKLRVGAATVTDLRIGSTPVNQVRLGSTVVWQR